jgi:hypothetical protein
MTAQHHGGNNGSSNCFIRAVNSQYVIFPAGQGQQHPTQAAADRYIANDVPIGSLFRTDRGDHEGGKEWIHGALAGCRDQTGYDDVSGEQQGFAPNRSSRERCLANDLSREPRP